MKFKFKKPVAILISMVVFAIIVTATVTDKTKGKRIRLKNGKGTEKVTLNPSRTYKFVINGKQFTKLSLYLKTKGGGKIQVEIKSPNGKILASGYGRRFTIKNVGSGDYQIRLRNRSKQNVAAGYIKFDGVDGE